MYFIAINSILGADLLWISELFFFETRTARIAYAPTLPPFGLQTGVADFTQESPKDISPYKRFL